MLTWSNTTVNAPSGGVDYTPTDAVLIGGQSYIFPWIASARPALNAAGQSGVPIEAAVRTKTTCFMRGLKERITVQTNTGSCWQWRRICFTMKGNLLYGSDGTNLRWSLLQTDVGRGAQGMVRVVNSVTGSQPGTNLIDILFKGRNGKDWNNVMSAPTDNTQVTIKYDKTRTIQSGNDDGILRTFSRWHPMGKNLVYNDDEAGSTEEVGRYSVPGKQGMGDYYVVDFVNSAFGSAPTDRMVLGINSTLYWHEK